MPIKDLLYKLGNTGERKFDLYKLKLRQKLGIAKPIQICPFMTYGNQNSIYIKGRVLENRNISTPEKEDSLLENILNTYKRFDSNEVAGAKILVKSNGTSKEFISDEDGFFEGIMDLSNPLPAEELWHNPVMELTEAPFQINDLILSRAKVMTPPETSTYGIISDIDDTILQTDATSILKSAWLTFFQNAYSRIPMKGVSAFYKAMQKGLDGINYNPVFYVSSSPWNLYDFLTAFIKINDIPEGPVLLKDYGFSGNKLWSEGHLIHKSKMIRNILNAYPKMKFILAGDSGQKDPEIYTEIVKEFPGRILAVYIRDASLNPRDEEVKKIKESLIEHKVDMVFAENSYVMALHAAEKGYISNMQLDEIKAKTIVDENPGERELEKILDEEIND